MLLIPESSSICLTREPLWYGKVESLSYLRLLQVNPVGPRRPVTSEFSTRILAIDLGASDAWWTFTEEWLTQMRLPAVVYPRATIMNLHRCRTSWNLVRRSGCTLVTSQEIPPPMDACGCRAIWLSSFSSESKLERRLQSWAAPITWLTSEERFRFCPLVPICWVSVETAHLVNSSKSGIERSPSFPGLYPSLWNLS